MIKRVISQLLFTALLFISSVHGAERPDLLFQYSTINALLNGLYDGDMHFSTLMKHGDVGLGTFNGLNGEMVGLDGKFYQVRTDGIAYPVTPSTLTPFAVVTYFDADSESSVPSGLDYSELKKHLDTLHSNKNHFQAIRIDGVFEAMKTRSVPAQKPPYKPLADVVAHQAIFDFTNVRGTMIGFYTPDYVSGLNVPGYHFHFLTEDRKRGGHVLGLQTKQGTIQKDDIKEFMMDLPENTSFSEMDLTGEKKSQLNKVEKLTHE